MISAGSEGPQPMTPYYDDGTCVIYHGDCLDVIPKLAPVDLVVTSPPYNLGTHPSGNGSGMHAGSLAAKSLAGGYGQYNDAMSQSEYDAWQTEVVHTLWGITTGAIFYNHKPRPMNGTLKLPLDYGGPVNTSRRVADALPLRQIVVWDRGTGMNFAPTHFLPKSEWIIVWARPDWRIDRAASALGDVWRFPPEQSDDHPAPFPLGLPARCIASCAPSTVLDPFMGSGTTLRAAKDAGVRCVGIELSERYCEIAAKRLAQEVLDFGGVA